MNGARDDVAFLARSKNRVNVLTTIGTDPVSRVELQEQTHVERVTLGRILGDFIERGWVTETDRQYALTPTGEMVAGDFENLLDTVTTAGKLERIIQWLPTEEMSFDLRHLGSVDITIPNNTDPAAPTRRAGQRLRNVKNVRLLMRVMVAEVIEACWDATLNDGQKFEAVLTADVIDTITADPTMSTRLHEMVRLDNVSIYQIEDDFPYVMGLLDDLAAFGVTTGEGLPLAYLETGDKVIREWMEATYCEYKHNATRIDPDEL